MIEVKLDYYKILGIKKTATLKEIKSAYRELAKEYHPDTCDANAGENAKEFEAIVDAYTILRDTEKRADYDKNGFYSSDINSTRVKALGKVAQLFDSMLNSVPLDSLLYVDIMGKIKEECSNIEYRLIENETDLEKQTEALSKFLDRILFSGKSDNILKTLVEDRLKRLREIKLKVAAEFDIHKEVLKLLKDYSIKDIEGLASSVTVLKK